MTRADKWLLKFLHWGLVLLIIGIPAYPKFPIISIPGTYVSIRAEDFLIAIVLGVWVIYIRDKWKPLWESTVIKAALLFLAAGLVSSLSALVVTQTGDPLQVILHTARRWEYLALLPVAMSLVKTRRQAFYYLQVVLLTIVIVLIYGLGQKLLDWPIISTMNKEYSQGIAQAIMYGGRINSTFAGHYDLAAYGVLMMSILFGLLAASKYWTSKLYLLGLIIGNGWLLVVSASRISFAAYMGSILMTMLLLRKWLWVVPVTLISVLAFFQTPALMDRYAEVIKYEFLPRIAKIEWPWRDWGKETQIAQAPTPTPTPTVTAPSTVTTVPGSGKPNPTPTPTVPKKSIAGTELEYVAPPEDRSTAIRFNVEWPRAVRAWTKNPLWGTGYSSITLATDNDYLRAMGETGTIGFLAFMLLLGSILVEMVKFIKNNFRTPVGAMAIGYVGGLGGFLANALFIDVFEASKVAIYFWLLSGIFLALISLSNDSKEKV